MIELDINPDFDAKIHKYHRNRSLSDIVNSCQKKLRNEIRAVKDAGSDDFTTVDSLLKNFLCCYYAINDQIDKRDIFSGEPGPDRIGLARVYSLYSSSKALLNLLNNEFIERIRAEEYQPPHVSITYSDINQASEYSVLTSVLSQLREHRGGTTSKSIRYSYFSFFNRLREISRSYLNSSCSPETKKRLNSIRINKKGLDFSEISPPQRREFSNNNGSSYSSSNSVEKLPTVLPAYEPDRRARIENIIGNLDARVALHAAAIRVLSYDKQLMRNPFSDEGRSFDDAFLAHGSPGVGKTFTVDAIVNHVLQRYRQDVQVVELSYGIKSMYIDRSAAIFERYITLEKEGNMSYINIIDEADGVFTCNENGEMHEESRKLLREMKNAINKNNKGNAIYIFMTNYPKQFEGALKQRFRLLHMEGATRPQEFSELLSKELGYAAQSLSKQEILELGKQLYLHKSRLSVRPRDFKEDDPDDIFVTGRTVKQIVAPFVSGNDYLLIRNEEVFRQASYAEKLQLIRQLMPDVSYGSVLGAINSKMESLQASCHNHC